jgi:hypothetical protein
MSHRLSLRALALATVAAGALIVPSTAAFAFTPLPEEDAKWTSVSE